VTTWQITKTGHAAAACPAEALMAQLRGAASNYDSAIGRDGGRITLKFTTGQVTQARERRAKDAGEWSEEYCKGCTYGAQQG
jgi:hypothetical protein